MIIIVTDREHRMANNEEKDKLWAEAKKRCRLNAQDIQLAKQLGMSPKSLLKNIPSPKEQWKLPVKDWIRSLAWEKGLIKEDKDDLPF